jgi:hypothetical protein
MFGEARQPRQKRSFAGTLRGTKRTGLYVYRRDGVLVGTGARPISERPLSRRFL